MPLAGIGFKLLSVLCFTVMVTLVKVLGERIPVGQLVFFRSFLGLLPLVGMILWQGTWQTALRT